MALDAIASQLEKFAELQYFVEASAVIVSALSGMIAAREKQLDIVGTYFIAFVTAFGGGTLRDLLLNRRPLFWVSHQEYPILIFVLTILFLSCSQHITPVKPMARKSFDLIDALGLALFSISGTSYALADRIPAFIAVLFGVITGVFGGVLRDITLVQIPCIFRQSTLYATCSFLGGWVYLLFMSFKLPPSFAGATGFATVVVMRMLALHYNLRLPVLYAKDSPDSFSPLSRKDIQ
ncbi:MAG: trimeric intracellular cation channel family protein [Oscillatoriophycideae cyanobacterium NC_groundwater_1537_Pr4_S-0.65um_50_18]|nr:trimeric intracellular cation channel family protein [Oscillatoriophycideae cyanobacterium NC_groundwater_1537_Pr4_S-0.65um_50_18]